jgi:hypothetical protein
MGQEPHLRPYHVDFSHHTELSILGRLWTATTTSGSPSARSAYCGFAGKAIISAASAARPLLVLWEHAEHRRSAARAYPR